MKYIVIMPVYEEFKKLPLIIPHIHEDLLIVDDGSKENISDSIRGMKYNKLIRLGKHQGKGAALKAGFNYAIQKNYDYVITIDSDGEHSPQDIEKFKQRLQHADIVIGQRKMFRSRHRRALNWLGALSFRQLLKGIEDTQCGFRGLRRELLEKLELKGCGFELETEVILEALKQNASFGFVNIKNNPSTRSSVTLTDYLKINDFFDTYVIKNKNALKPPLQLQALAYFGMINSYFVRKIFKK